MKILHLISQHPESTGSGYYIQNIIHQAKAVGHQNFLVAGITGHLSPKLDCITNSSCKFVRFHHGGKLDYPIPGMSDVMPYPSSVFSTLSSDQIDIYEQEFAAALQEAVDHFAPDIIHSHHLWLATAVARKQFPEIPLVTSCHSTDLRQFQGCPHLRKRILSPCRKIDRILALSRSQAKQIEELYSIVSEKIDIVGGGFDESLFTLQQKEKSSKVYILYGGKLSFSKGVDVLLKTVQSLNSDSFHLHLAGSGTGEEEHHCLQLAEKVSSHVTVHGRISQQKLAKLMGMCHLFILPSFYEGLPLVLLEALGSGCRIITTDLTGCKELLGTADPDLVEYIELPPMKQIDRPEAEDLPMVQDRLAKAIEAMMAKVMQSPSPDPEKIREITTQFSWDAVFTRINRVYEKVISS